MALIASYVFGILGIVANVLVYQQKKGKKLLFYKLISDFLWAAHYSCLFAWSAAAVAVFGIFREFVFSNQDKKWAQSKLWLMFFLMCSGAVAVLTWKGVFSILPAMASALSVISFWRSDPKLSRRMAFPISGCMLTYDLTCSSYTGIANEILTLVSSVIGIIRYSRTNKTPRKNRGVLFYLFIPLYVALTFS